MQAGDECPAHNGGNTIRVDGGVEIHNLSPHHARPGRPGEEPESVTN